MSVSIVSARLPTGDTPVCNVTLEPYVLIKRGDTTVTADDIPEEGSPEPGLQLRSRWYRSSIPRGGAVCSVHPDKEATVQCTVCLRCKVAVHLSYHCSAECFRGSWQQHREYHATAHANGERRRRRQAQQLQQQRSTHSSSSAAIGDAAQQLRAVDRAADAVPLLRRVAAAQARRTAWTRRARWSAAP